MTAERPPKSLPFPLRIVVIDDETMVVFLIAGWLGKQPWANVVGTAHTGQDGIALCRNLRPDIALLDVEMPDRSGLDVARELQTESPETRILILSGHFEPLLVYKALRLGVHGYLEKQNSLDQLEAAIHRIAGGGAYYSHVFNAIREGCLAAPDSFHKILSDLEMEVLMLMSAGFSDMEIGKRRGIAVNTVSTHRRNMRKKLNVHNDRELIAYAQKWGIVPRSELDAKPS